MYRYYLKARAFHGTLVQDEEAEVSYMYRERGREGGREEEREGGMAVDTLKTDVVH